MIKPYNLNAGDKIGIVATGKRVQDQDIEHAIQIFSSWGLLVVLGKNLFSKDHSYLAADDDKRLNDLQEMLDNVEIKAIVGARGGYGTTRIIDRLDFTSFHKSPKWIVGFSDVTALHLKLFKAGYESIHGIMPILFARTEAHDSVESLKALLFASQLHINVGPAPKNRIGKATGQVLGGNLSLIVDSLGTSSDVDFDDKILIIEEIDEYLYKIDRMLTQLLRSKKLSKLKGLIIGHMTELKDTNPGFGESMEEVILGKVNEFSYPIAFNFPVGHDFPNLAWIQGATMTLTVDDNGSSLVQAEYS